MAQAKVWNDHTKDHTEIFKGDKIVVPALGFILMDKDDAYQFRSQFTPILATADGGHNPDSCKKIRVEEIASEVKSEEKPTFVCQACKFGAMNAKDLETHIDERHLDKLMDQDLADTRRKGKKTA